ncbi:40-residue YVTN family beta-propeller repeat-containing protein [Sulfitobacter marinus]|uniref:40-residue YVTN family beta-propeller repeat-containing protein n=1 Tax=Sulfitobacter marinus TaxID=394264 RepID=A0A1I6V6J9_9RHOB|nr:beta-propeller fold lactonase family protein [Sulfitobacter marinus]SFT09388.1 40-residue YVTN family beta-propeller repeat-containing protein [Sulfitobacter marinus]
MRLPVRLVAAAGFALVATPAIAGDLAFVTCQNGDGVSLLDLDAGTQITQWSVLGKPAGVAVAGADVFTVAPDSKTVRRHTAATGKITAEIQLDGGPIGVAYDHERGRLFVSDWYNARIWVLAEHDLAHLTDIPTGAAPAGLALSDDGRFLASADRDSDQVSIFDADTLTLHRRIDVGSRPFGLRFAPDGRLFVANVGSNDVTVIGPQMDKTVATFAVEERPYGVAFAHGRVFVTNQYADTVSVVDTNTFQTIATLPSGEYPEGVDTSTDNRSIIVANWFDNSVTIIDAVTLSVIKEIETCDGPRAFGEFVQRDFR